MRPPPPPPPPPGGGEKKKKPNHPPPPQPQHLPPPPPPPPPSLPPAEHLRFVLRVEATPPRSVRGGSGLQARGQVLEQTAGRLDARGHRDQLVAQRLMLDQPLAERHALLRPIRSLVQAHARQAVALRRKP